jgi:nitrite reductase/ring-hydroxylating ferredoxin subunit
VSLVRLARRPAPGERLCAFDELDADLGTRRFMWLEADGPRRFFLLRRGDALYAYWNECPHHGVALESPEHGLFSDDRSLLQCGFHGARFRFEDGLCVHGPCLGRSLPPFPVALAGGEVRAG